MHKHSPLAPDLARELVLLEAGWARLSGIQRVHRTALIQLRTAEEWAVLGDIFTRRAAILGWREEAA